MLTGKHFRLEHATLAVSTADDGQRRSTTIPAGSVITVESGPNHHDGMVNVLWQGEVLEMFTVDVDVRGTEIIEKSSSHATRG